MENQLRSIIQETGTTEVSYKAIEIEKADPETSQSYSKTVIDESKGERWFCTEAEAVAAGWRKAKNCP